jgi:hypothetical protein
MAATNTSLLNFDRHQFAGRRSQPVHAEHIAGEIETTGVSYEDYSRMHTFGRAKAVHRYKPIPFWVYNKAQLAELIVHYMESRSGCKTPQDGTLVQRLERAKTRLASSAPRLTDLMTRLCREYVAAKKQDPVSPRVRELAVEIANLDTQLLFIHKAEVMVAGVIWRSYNLGENSVEVGLAMGLRPPHVRAILHKLNRTWNKMPERAAAAATAADRKTAREATAATCKAAREAKRTARREAKAARKAAATKRTDAAAQHKAAREAIVAAAATRFKATREAIATRKAEKAAAQQVAIDRYKAGVPVAGVPLRTKAKAATVVTACTA